MVTNENNDDNFFPKIPERILVEDGSGTLVSIINADTSEVQINQNKIHGLGNIADNVEGLTRAAMALFKLGEELGYTWTGEQWVKS